MEKRKKGRPPLPKNVEEYVITAAMKNPTMKRLALAAKVEQELKSQRITPPAKDTMLKLFQKAPKPGEEDVPWSLGKSMEYHLSPEASADLLCIWRFCLAAGRDFTIRQAKWVCYIRSSRDVTRFQEKLTVPWIYNIAALYANRERICGALNIAIDTLDLDVRLAIERREFISAIKTGVLVKNLLYAKPKELPEFGIPESEPYFGSVITTVLEDLGFEDKPDYYLPEPSIKVLIPLAEESEYIYALWLRYIGKGPQWGQLSYKDRENILFALKNEIINVMADERHFDRWEPTKELKAVGYEPNYDPMSATMEIIDPVNISNRGGTK